VAVDPEAVAAVRLARQDAAARVEVGVEVLVQALDPKPGLERGVDHLGERVGVLDRLGRCDREILSRV
jgi:hypothetical protein